MIAVAAFALLAGAAAVGAKIERKHAQEAHDQGRAADALVLEARAAELDVSYEALAVALGVGHRVAGGKGFLDAVLDEEQSEECQKLLELLTKPKN